MVKVKEFFNVANMVMLISSTTAGSYSIGKETSSALRPTDSLEITVKLAPIAGEVSET